MDEFFIIIDLIKNTIIRSNTDTIFFRISTLQFFTICWTWIIGEIINLSRNRTHNIFWKFSKILGSLGCNKNFIANHLLLILASPFPKEWGFLFATRAWQVNHNNLPTTRDIL